MNSHESADLALALDGCANALAAHRHALQELTLQDVHAAIGELERAIAELSQAASAGSAAPIGAARDLAAQAQAEYALVLSLLQLTNEYLRFRTTLTGVAAGYDRLGRSADGMLNGVFEGSA